MKEICKLIGLTICGVVLAILVIIPLVTVHRLSYGFTGLPYGWFLKLTKGNRRQASFIMGVYALTLLLMCGWGVCRWII